MQQLKDFDSVARETQTMSSREIAELTGKNHQHVLRDCDKLNEHYHEMGLSKIGQSSYINEQGREFRQYLLTRIQTFDLMTGYDVKLRIKVNRRWEELEQKQSIDFSDPKNVLQVVQKWVESEEHRKLLKAQNELQAAELKEAAPKVDYYDKVLQSKNSITTTVIAKDLGMSAKSLNQLLHKRGIIYRVDGTWVLYSKYQNKGYTKSKTHYYTNSKGEMDTSVLTCWTQKGRKFIMAVAESYMNKATGGPVMKVS